MYDAARSILCGVSLVPERSTTEAPVREALRLGRHRLAWCMFEYGLGAAAALLERATVLTLDSEHRAEGALAEV